LVIATQDASSHVRTEVAPQTSQDLGFKPENIDVVVNAMVGVTQEGTSTRVFLGAPYLSGGKTGTAQAVSLGKNEKYNAARMEERQRDHSLYVAFAPAKDPEIALAVIVENAGFGATSAAPIARRVFDYWLLGQYPSAEDIVAVSKGQAAAPLGQARRAADVPWPPPGTRP
jgi:penicillin-binding protein 2